MIMNYKGFQYKGKLHRVVRRAVRELERGYTEATVEHYQVLQVRRSFWSTVCHLNKWQEVEREHIPSFAWIANATLGSTDWKSPMLHRLAGELA
jgi:hypothetical protein